MKIVAQNKLNAAVASPPMEKAARKNERNEDTGKINIA